MNAQTARMFLAIVEHGSISAAARALYITQPALSAHLGRLEEELGTQLMRRQKGIHQITLTPEGTAFIPIAREWVAAEDHLLRYKDTVSQKTIRLVSSVALHDSLISPVVSKLLREDPQISVQQNILDISEKLLPERIHSFDAAFLNFTDPDPSLVQCIPLYSQGWCILCPADSPLPNRILSPAELDPAFEVVQKFPSARIREWHDTVFSTGADQAYAQATAIMSMPNYFSDSRCWCICAASIAMFLVAQRPNILSCREVEPEPSHSTTSLLISRAYAREDVIDTLLRCCREYLQERPYLTPLLK